MGISNWSGIVEEVRKLKFKDDEKTSEELLKRVKKNDFAPKSKEGEYPTRSCWKSSELP